MVPTGKTLLVHTDIEGGGWRGQYTMLSRELVDSFALFSKLSVVISRFLSHMFLQ